MQIQRIPRLHIVAHVDATTPDIAAWESGSTEAFEKAAGPDVLVDVQLRHNGTNNSIPLEKTEAVRAAEKARAGKGWLAALGFGAATVALCALGNPLGPLPGVGALLGCLGSAGYAAAVGVGASSDHLAWVELPVGTHHLRIGNDRTERLDSQPHFSQPETAADPQALAQFLSDSWKSPATKVFLLAGHGHGYRGCAGFTLEEISSAIRPHQPELVVFESCLMSNLEALVKLQGSGNWCISSENIQAAGQGHWKALLETLPAGKLDGETLGRHLLSQGKDRGELTSTLALVDLNKIGSVGQAVEKLAARLQSLGHRRGELREALLRATKIERAAADFRDLGSVIRHLGEVVDDPLLAEVEQAHQKAMPASWTRTNLSLLSIQGPNDLPADYDALPEWGKFLRWLDPADS